MGDRTAVLNALADRVQARSRELVHPCRVGIDGADGAGKTTLRCDLATELRARGVPVIEASLDDFHHVKARRYRRGRDSWQGYWHDAFDLRRVRRELLEPLGLVGDLRYRTRGHDLATDEVLDGPWENADLDAVLLFDGVLLQRPELAQALDYVIFVDAPEDERYRRMAVRDGIDPDPEALKNLRYTLVQRHYRWSREPLRWADAVVDNTDPELPELVPPAVAPTR